MSVGDVRVYKCTVHDKLSCTRLQNYTIGASPKSVSVPWNLSLTMCGAGECAARVFKLAFHGAESPTRTLSSSRESRGNRTYRRVGRVGVGVGVVEWQLYTTLS